MSGHSKWSTIKRAKGAADAKRGKIFSRISRDITLAAKDGGGDPDANPRLRTVLLKAREANMPADNIDRAIKKGTGELPGVIIEEITYEGYGSHGIAFVVKVTTDNKTRAAQELRSTFSKGGGNLAQSGAVAFQFLHAGQFLIAKDQTDEDRLMEVALEAGADDIISSDHGFEVRCELHEFDKVTQPSACPSMMSAPPNQSLSCTTPSIPWTTCRPSSPTKKSMNPSPRKPTQKSNLALIMYDPAAACASPYAAFYFPECPK